MYLKYIIKNQSWIGYNINNHSYNIVRVLVLDFALTIQSKYMSFTSWEVLLMKKTWPRACTRYVQNFHPFFSMKGKRKIFQNKL